MLVDLLRTLRHCIAMTYNVETVSFDNDVFSMHDYYFRSEVDEDAPNFVYKLWHPDLIEVQWYNHNIGHDIEINQHVCDEDLVEMFMTCIRSLKNV